MSLPAEFVNGFVKKKEALRSDLKLAVKFAVDELYNFVLDEVEKMLTSSPELSYSQVEEAAQKLLDSANQAFSSDILQQQTLKDVLTENNPSSDPSSYLPTENLGNSKYSNSNSGNDNVCSTSVTPVARKRIFLDSTRNSSLSTEVVNSEQRYSPTSDYKANSSEQNEHNDSWSYIPIQDEDDEPESTKKIVKRFFRPSPEHITNFFSDESDEEQELFSSVVAQYTIESLTCLQCDQEFVDKGSLDEHLLEAHETHIYSCPLPMCNKSFKYPNEFADHEKLHSNVNSWDCYVCSYNTMEMKKLANHITQEHENGKFRCTKEGCNVVSGTRAEAERHFASGNHTIT